MDVAADTQPIAIRPKQLRSATTNGNRPFVLGGDGRGAWVRRWKDIVELHVSDLGGQDACSEAQLSTCRRIATTTVELERMEARMSNDEEVDLDVYNRMAGNLRRMLETIGIERRQRDVTDDIDEVLARVAKRRGNASG
jgi:hypothetical protein